VNELKSPYSIVISGLKEKGAEMWQREWDASAKGDVTITFFPTVKGRISKILQMCINLSIIVTGHGELRLYFHRF
jgi:hypothetical protein